MRRPLSLALATLAVAALQGCATYYSVPLRSTGPVPGQTVQQAAPGMSIG